MMHSTAFTTLEDAAARGDAVRFWREPHYGGLECLSAVFRRHRYVPHTHETYAVAGIVEGCEAFHHRGVRRYAPAGSIAVVCPDELHDGEPAGEEFAYRTLYPSVELMRSIAEDVLGRPVTGTPSFARSVMEDPALTAQLAFLHGRLADPGAPLLERDSLLDAFFGTLILRYGSFDAPAPRKPEHKAVARVRDFLDANYAQETTLADLAAIAGLNRAHLVRAFRERMGITPHAYLVDRRFRAARRKLLAGKSPAQVAVACGFFDQSHLNRVFKARMAVTPGLYRG
jgi:AraC-like DNA-binding protein